MGCVSSSSTEASRCVPPACFNDLAGWLMLYGESTVLVLELPAIDAFRRAARKDARTAVTAAREPVLEEEPE